VNTPLSKLDEFFDYQFSEKLIQDRRHVMDDSKITSELGWKPTHTLATGLGETVTWYLQHQDWVQSVEAPQAA
jgi:dTDP-glucose 4,6-dehydratase